MENEKDAKGTVALMDQKHEMVLIGFFYKGFLAVKVESSY